MNIIYIFCNIAHQSFVYKHHTCLQCVPKFINTYNYAYRDDS